MTTSPGARRRRQLLKVAPWCNYCGAPLSEFNATVDHIEARAWGGTNARDNCVLACHRCNDFKGCDPIEVFACPARRGGELRYVWEVTFTERDSMSNVVSFNYETLEESLRASTAAHAEEIRKMVQRASADIVAIGKRLIDVHASIGKDHFQAWLRAEFHWSQTTASNYMRAAAKFGKLDCLSFFQPTALCLFVRKNVSQAAIDEATRRARKRVMITYVEARRLIEKHADPAASPPATLPAIRARTFINALAGRIEPGERAALADELVKLAALLRGSVTQAAPVKQPALPVPAPRPTKEQGRRKPAA